MKILNWKFGIWDLKILDFELKSFILNPLHEIVFSLPFFLELIFDFFRRVKEKKRKTYIYFGSWLSQLSLTELT